MDVILHCSDSSWGNAVVIDQWHAEKGFKNAYGIHVGYHFVVLNGHLNANKFNHFCDGLIETGRALDDDDQFEFDETAAATLGKNNCVQICLIGLSGQFTDKQLKAVATVLGWLKAIFHSIKVYQHKDFDPVNRPYCAGLTDAQLQAFNQL